MKWTTERIPEGVPVNATINGTVLCVTRQDNRLYIRGSTTFYIEPPGTRWLPIPTEAECQKWERLREAVKALGLKPLYKRKPEDYMQCFQSCDKINAVVEALAALEAEKETRND